MKRKKFLSYKGGYNTPLNISKKNYEKLGKEGKTTQTKKNSPKNPSP